mmetsp:Transcript_9023/g.16772  ORF Transcript_9023/g.16772 Transcript_9023/m.16772 type:complete len:510 (-) Transcript_9023:563-2092(-)
MEADAGSRSNRRGGLSPGVDSIGAAAGAGLRLSTERRRRGGGGGEADENEEDGKGGGRGGGCGKRSRRRRRPRAGRPGAGPGPAAADRPAGGGRRLNSAGLPFGGGNKCECDSGRVREQFVQATVAVRPSFALEAEADLADAEISESCLPRAREPPLPGCRATAAIIHPSSSSGRRARRDRPVRRDGRGRIAPPPGHYPSASNTNDRDAAGKRRIGHGGLGRRRGHDSPLLVVGAARPGPSLPDRLRGGDDVDWRRASSAPGPDADATQPSFGLRAIAGRGGQGGGGGNRGGRQRQMQRRRRRNGPCQGGRGFDGPRSALGEGGAAAAARRLRMLERVSALLQRRRAKEADASHFGQRRWHRRGARAHSCSRRRRRHRRQEGRRRGRGQRPLILARRPRRFVRPVSPSRPPARPQSSSLPTEPNGRPGESAPPLRRGISAGTLPGRNYVRHLGAAFGRVRRAARIRRGSEGVQRAGSTGAARGDRRGDRTVRGLQRGRGGGQRRCRRRR